MRKTGFFSRLIDKFQALSKVKPGTGGITNEEQIPLNNANGGIEGDGKN